MNTGETLPQARGAARLRRDLLLALIFLTRLPLRLSQPLPSDALAQASWAFPLAGLVVGAVGGTVGWLAGDWGAPPFAAALLALTATVLMTGGLHEDGLADLADGLGGGATVARKLDIMKDSRIGSYGALALILSLGLRASALAALAGHSFALWVATLAAAHALARAGMPVAMRLLPPARPGGLGAGAGRPGWSPVLAGCALALLIAATGLIGAGVGGPGFVLRVAAISALGGLACALQARRHLGGFTGDVLGAVEQVMEILALLAACP